LNLRLVSIGALRALVATLRQQRPTIVQSHGARSNVYTRLAGRLAGVPVVLSTVHNSLFDYGVSPLRRRLYVLADRLTSPLAHRIVAVSHAIASDLVQRYGIPREKVLTIWNGIDPASFVARRPRVHVLEEFGLREHDRLIGIAARMTPQKGHEVLFRALHFLVPRFPYLRCLVIGDGPLESALRDQAAALGITHHCIFTGARTDVADLLAAVEVAVLPSRSEGDGPRKTSCRHTCQRDSRGC
jgi:glycosyltransferase involved in cell wall biosynthesis